MLLHSFRKMGSDVSEINDYVSNHEKFLIRETLTKEEFLKMVNDENYQCLGKVKQLHDQIYGAFLAKVMVDNPSIKAKRDYNKKGQIIANYLQDVEFQMLKELFVLL